VLDGEPEWSSPPQKLTVSARLRMSLNSLSTASLVSTL